MLIDHVEAWCKKEEPFTSTNLSNLRMQRLFSESQTSFALFALFVVKRKLEPVGAEQRPAPGRHADSSQLRDCPCAGGPVTVPIPVCLSAGCLQKKYD